MTTGGDIPRLGEYVGDIFAILYDQPACPELRLLWVGENRHARIHDLISR